MTHNYKEKLYILDEKDHYKILGISEFADSDTISKEYKKLAKQFHPDKHPTLNPTEKEELNVIFKKITSAFNFLKDPSERKRYDSEMNLRRVKARDLEIKKDIKVEHKPANEKATFTFNSVNMNVDLEAIKAEKIRKEREQAQGLFNQAKKLLQNQSYDEAITILRGLTEKYGKEAIYHSHLGLAMEGKGWTGYAQAEFKVALYYNPSDEVALKHYKPSPKTLDQQAAKTGTNDNNSDSKGVMGKLRSFFGK